jgi:voltage-gated potassium channel
VFRLVRVYRLLSSYGTKNILRSLVRDRAESAFLTLLLLGILVLEFASLGILRIEGHIDGSNITTASDALWYVLVTISTVGYGDRFPVTNQGRLLGALIIVIGVGIFGTFTGFLANLFLAPRRADKGADEDAADDTDDPLQTLDRMRELLAQQQATIAELDHLLQTRE